MNKNVPNKKIEKQMHPQKIFRIKMIKSKKDRGLNVVIIPNNVKLTYRTISDNFHPLFEHGVHGKILNHPTLR